MTPSTFTSYHLTPLGTIEIKANETHLLSVQFVEKITTENPKEITKRCTVQLEEYFNKQRTMLDLPIHFEGTEFQQKVWNTLLTIPFGRTWSYKDLALKAGKAGSVRAVG